MEKKIVTKNKINKNILESSNLNQLLMKNHLTLTVTLKPINQNIVKTTKLHHSIIKNNQFFNQFFNDNVAYSLYLNIFDNQSDTITCSNNIDFESLTILKANNLYFNMNKNMFENSFVPNSNSILNECLLSVTFIDSEEL